MDETSFPMHGLDDDRLAAHATAVTPAWLWSSDGARVMWANPAACAVFGATGPALAARLFRPGEPARVEVERLATSLPPSGTPRLERLRRLTEGTHLSSWRPLVCACSRFPLDAATAILMVATDAIGPALSLEERVRRLDLDGDAAAATTGGAILLATGDAPRRLAGATSVAAIGATALCARAIASGDAAGSTRIGPVTVRRIGSGAGTILLLRFGRAGTELADVSPEPATPPEPDAPLEPVAPPESVVPPVMVVPPQPVTPAEPIEAAVRPRGYPLRFVWQMDPGGRFTLGSDEFTEIIGVRNAIALGRPWQEINAALGLDLPGRIYAAVATRETFSGIAISWPVEGSAERLDVTMSGLPAFDRNRKFLGYRGFGVCRDVDRIESLRAMRRLAMFAPGLADAAAPPAREPVDDDRDAGQTVGQNVVPFPGSAVFAEAKPGDAKSLSPGEHNAFRELARQLTARLQTGEVVESAREAGDQPIMDGSAIAAPDSQGDSARPGHDVSPEWAVDHALLNRLPVGILVYRLDDVLFANRACLAMAGYADLTALAAAGSLNALFADTGIGVLAESGEGGRAVAIATRPGDRLPVVARLAAVLWDGAPAFAVVLTTIDAEPRTRPADAAPAETAMDRSTALTTLCHNARAPLNSILGFCDMMLEERYGSIGNERYRAYVGDVRRAGAQLMAFLTDAVDLARIEAGTFSLTPVAVSLNDVVSECVLAMQPQANEARVIVRMSLAPLAHKVFADVAAVRQIVANLLGHVIRGSRPGGQVIVSTGISAAGEAVLRLRDNGDGLSEQSIAAALTASGPQPTTPPWSAAGQTLPLTKALAEANHARLKITSKPREGSLFEVSFSGKAETGDSISASR